MVQISRHSVIVGWLCFGAPLTTDTTENETDYYLSFKGSSASYVVQQRKSHKNSSPGGYFNEWENGREESRALVSCMLLLLLLLQLNFFLAFSHNKLFFFLLANHRRSQLSHKMAYSSKSCTATASFATIWTAHGPLQVATAVH